MGTVSNVLKLTLGQEDAFGRVLAGSTGKGVRTLYSEAKAAEGSTFKNFINKAATEVDSFTSLTGKIDQYKLDKTTLKALQKSSGNMKTFWKNMQRVINGEDVSKVFAEAPEAAEALAKKIAAGGDDLIKEGSKTGVFARMGKFISEKIPALSKLKGKGGTLGIALAAVFEVPQIIKAFKNGDGLQQIGRSAINMAGCAAGAAAGAAIGSVIPVAGTIVGGIIGAVLGFAGSMLGADVAKKAGDAIFGKSIEEQKTEAAEAQAEQAEANTAQVAYVPSATVSSTADAGTSTSSRSTEMVYTYGFKPLPKIDVKA